MKNLLLFLLALIVVAPAWGGNAISLAGITIELNNPPDSNSDNVPALVAKLKKDPVYKAAQCGPAKTVDATTKIDCAKNDSKLMAFLTKNASPSVLWSIISYNGEKCLPGCTTMHCPPPNGPVMCCNTSTYKAC